MAEASLLTGRFVNLRAGSVPNALRMQCVRRTVLLMPKHKTQPWKETQPTRAIRLSDSLWSEIGKAATKAKKTRADIVREAVEAFLKLTFVIIALLSSCGGRSDLLEEPDVGGKQDIFVPLGAGIRTDLSDALLPVGKDLELENRQFDQLGSTIKRFGHLAQPVTISPGGATILQPWQLASHKGARVSVSGTPIGIPSAPLSAYSPGDAAWNIPPSDKRGPITTKLTKIKTGANNPRMAVGGGFFYLLYADLLTSGLMHFDIVDAATGHVTVSQTFLVGGLPLSGYDVVFCNGFAVAITGEAGVGVVFRRLTPSSKSITPTTFAATFASAAFDVIVNGTVVSVVYGNNTAQAAGVDFDPAALTTAGFAIHDAAAATIPVDLGKAAWMLDYGGSGKVALITASSTQGVRVQWALSAGATRTATTTFNADPTVTANVAELAGYTSASSAAGTFKVLISVSAAATYNYFTKLAFATGGVLTAPGFVMYRSICLLSKPWTYSGDFFALFSFDSPSDGNSYVMRINGQGAQPALAAPQAIFGVGTTGNIDQFGSRNQGLVNVSPLTASTFATSIAFLNRIGEQADASFSATSIGVDLVTISHLQPADSPTTGPPIEIADSLIVPGGTLNQFDGVNYGELGFAYQAIAPTLTPGAGGSLTANSIYWYVAVWSRMDAQGRLWRSGTSIPASVSLGANTKVTVAIPTLRVTGWGTVICELYRGAANDENLFQKVGQVPNDVTVDTVTFVDTFSDAQLAIGEQLYTGQNNNAILNNDTIPGSPFVFIFQNRMWFISADNPTELWFSNIMSPGNGVRFNSQNIVRLDDAHGPVYSAAAMDDKVIAVKGDAVYSWAGDGPDDAGNGGYAPPQIVTLGVGSTNPRSVLTSRDGVFLMSTSDRPGIQMVDRGLSLGAATDGSGAGYGAAVEKYANEQVMSAISIPEQSQVRFYCLSGRVLVYDLTAKAWSTFLLNTAGAHVVSATPTNGAALIALDNQTIWLEDISGATYSDAGNAYGSRIATPWIAVDGIMGFQRLMDMIGRGATLGDHTLTIQKLHNFDDNTIIETKTFAETVALTPLWNWEWIPRYQRMSSAKLILSESSTTAGFKAQGVAMLLGLRQGLNRQPTTTRGP